MSKRDPKQPSLMPRHNGFRRIDEIMDEMFGGLGLQPVERHSAGDAEASPGRTRRTSTTSSPKVAVMKPKNELARRLRLAARALRRATGVLPEDSTSVPYPRAAGDLERLRGNVADGSAWLDELAVEVERLAAQKPEDQS